MNAPDVTYFCARAKHLASGLAMSTLVETSNEPAEVKEGQEFDVEAQDHFGDDYVVDPTRYLFYR